MRNGLYCPPARAAFHFPFPITLYPLPNICYTPPTQHFIFRMFMNNILQTILYQPMFNGFVALYNIIPDVGVVIILITIIIKIILYPLNKKAITAQKSMSELQPKMEAIKTQYKGDQQKIAQETMQLYKEHKVNPLGSCLPILIQLPVFIAIYYVLRAGLSNGSFDLLYPFVKNPGAIKTVSLGLLDLAKASYVLAVLAGAAQFWQAKMMYRKQPPKEAGAGGKDENMMAIMNKQMLYMMPVMTVVIGMSLPGGLSLYWFISTLLTALQQKVMMRKDGGTPKDGGAVIEGKLVS